MLIQRGNGYFALIPFFANVFFFCFIQVPKNQGRDFTMVDLTIDVDGKPAPFGGGGYGSHVTPTKAASISGGKVLSATLKPQY